MQPHDNYIPVQVQYDRPHGASRAAGLGESKRSVRTTAEGVSRRARRMTYTICTSVRCMLPLYRLLISRMQTISEIEASQAVLLS